MITFWRDDLTERFLRFRVLGAYIWRGLFLEFYGSLCIMKVFRKGKS